MISTVDPDARHTRKSPEARRDGYRAHVAAEPQTGIITDEQITRAAGEEHSDAAVAGQMMAREAEPAEVYGDSACGTGDLRAALAEGGHTAVIKPKPLKPAVDGGFTLDDFTASEQAGTVTCPNGVTRRITARRNVTFGAACRTCPLRARCTTNKTGRALILHEHDALLRAARRDWRASPALQENYSKYRPNVERAVAQAATWRGRGLKLRYRGTTRNNAWLKRRTAALNLRNLIGRGLAPRDGPGCRRPPDRWLPRPSSRSPAPGPARHQAAGSRPHSRSRRKPGQPVTATTRTGPPNHQPANWPISARS